MECIFENAITAREVIEALNVEPPSQRSYDTFAEKYLAGADPDPLPGGSWIMPKTISREERRLMSAALVSSDLRAAVDAWLDTGRNLDGAESPNRRDFSKPVNMLLDVLDYMRESPAQFIPSLEPRGFVVRIADRGSSPWASNFFQAQRVEATRLLVGIMVSDWKECLCKCRHPQCGRYFLHAKPRLFYRYGTFCCREHHKNASANVCTRLKRRSAEAELIEVAAKRLRKWRVNGPQWHEDCAKKKRLADELTNYITGVQTGCIKPNLKAYHQEVKVNWVTRNRQKIENKRLALAS